MALYNINRLFVAMDICVPCEVRTGFYTLLTWMLVLKSCSLNPDEFFWLSPCHKFFKVQIKIEVQESITEYLLSYECYCINVNFEIIWYYTDWCINRFRSQKYDSFQYSYFILCKIRSGHVGDLEVNSTFFQDLVPCGWVEICCCFRGIYCFHFGRVED